MKELSDACRVLQQRAEDYPARTSQDSGTARVLQASSPTPSSSLTRWTKAAVSPTPLREGSSSQATRDPRNNKRAQELPRSTWSEPQRGPEVFSSIKWRRGPSQGWLWQWNASFLENHKPGPEWVSKSLAYHGDSRHYCSCPGTCTEELLHVGLLNK